jgi:flagellar hook-length control protein FliK
VASQLVPHVAVLRGAPDGSHSMTVVLSPENLGPVQLQVTLTNGTLDMTLRGAHEHGRSALMAALPDLRRDLQAAGLSCSKLDVDAEAGGSWSAQHQSAQQQAAQQQSGEGRGWAMRSENARPRGRSAELGQVRPIPVSSGPTSSGVDFFA